jgi:hypothetical protein
MPAPPAAGGWGPGAPQAMERPVTVRAGLGAFIASLVLSLVGSVATILNWDEFVDWALAQGQTDLNSADLDLDEEAVIELGLQIGIGVALLFTFAYLLFFWFAWKGYNWARIVLWVLGGLGVVSGLVSLAGPAGGGPLPFVTALSWFQWILTAVGIVLLALKPSNDWFRYRKWLRATGQPG